MSGEAVTRHAAHFHIDGWELRPPGLSETLMRRRRVAAFHDLGIETFMLQFQPFEREMRCFAAEVIRASADRPAKRRLQRGAGPERWQSGHAGGRRRRDPPPLRLSGPSNCFSRWSVPMHDVRISRG